MAKHNEWKKSKTIYWKDELHDDFDELGLTRPSVPQNYKYIRSNPINNFFSGILYHVIAVPVLYIYCFFHGIRVENKRHYRKIKRLGGFIYANHVAISDVFKHQAMISFGKRINILGYSDTLSMPFVRNICRGLGYLPLPLQGDNDNFKNLIEAMRYYVKEKRQAILIYPEAHIWPYYTKVRNFPSGSFTYPSKYHTPVVPIVTAWRKPIVGKKPKQTILVGNPIFPQENLSTSENKEYLYNECLKAMKEMSESIKQYEYIKYINLLLFNMPL